MVRLLLLLFWLQLAGLVFAQGTIVRIEKDNAREIKGELVKGKRADVIGTTYLYEDWKKGVFLMADGSRFEMQEIKLDLVKNELYYQIDGALFIVNQPIKEFWIEAPDGRKIFRYLTSAQGKQSAPRFYEVLYEQGDWFLLKSNLKTKQEQYQYNVGTVVEYVDLVRYFLYQQKSTNMYQVGKEVRSFQPFYAGKEKAAEAYIDLKGRRFDGEKEMIDFLRNLSNQ